MAAMPGACLPNKLEVVWTAHVISEGTWLRSLIALLLQDGR